MTQDPARRSRCVDIGVVCEGDDHRLEVRLIAESELVAMLVDAAGRLRWIDVGAEPFMDVKFLLAESKRLLSLGSQPHSSTHAVQGPAE